MFGSYLETFEQNVIGSNDKGIVEEKMIFPNKYSIHSYSYISRNLLFYYSFLFIYNLIVMYDILNIFF